MAVPKSPTKNQPPKEGDKNPEKSQFMASKAPSLINKSNPWPPFQITFNSATEPGNFLTLSLSGLKVQAKAAWVFHTTTVSSSLCTWRWIDHGWAYHVSDSPLYPSSPASFFFITPSLLFLPMVESGLCSSQVRFCCVWFPGKWRKVEWKWIDFEVFFLFNCYCYCFGHPLRRCLLQSFLA